MKARLCSTGGFSDVQADCGPECNSMHLVATDGESASRMRPGKAVLWYAEMPDRDIVSVTRAATWHHARPIEVEIVTVSHGAAIARKVGAT
jgi:hypothetical protein